MTKPIVLPVLKVKQPIGEFYVASMSAMQLVEISYSDVRRLASDQRDVEKYLGIQRPISASRIKEIRDYINSADATFPTSVILSVDENCAEFEKIDDKMGRLYLRPFSGVKGELEPIPVGKIAKVLDGQHRIAAFMDEDENWSFDFDDDFEINVAIFIGADISEQANIFATVNLAQTKVNRSLVYDLTELSRTPSPYKTCHNVAVTLDSVESSPLYRRIKRLGTATPGRKHEPLTQASFVESLVKFISTNPNRDRDILLRGGKIKSVSDDELLVSPFRWLFAKGREDDITEIIYNYFSAIQEKWPHSWAAISTVGNILPRSNAFKAFMVYLRQDVYNDLSSNSDKVVPDVEDFLEALSHVKLRDRDFTTNNFKPGSGGQSTFLKMLRGEISLRDMVE